MSSRAKQPEGYLLAVDTSSELLGVGLMPVGETIDCESERIQTLEIDAGLRHVERVAPAVEELLDLASVSPKEIRGLIGARGPGSFTGLRIAVSLLKGISAVCGAPVVLVPTLEAHAEPYRREPAAVCSLLDARKGRFYVQFFRKGEYLTPALDLTPEELGDRAESLLAEAEKLLLAGPDAGKLNPLPAGALLPALRRRSAVRGLLVRGEKLLERGETLADSGGPLYLRGSEAVFPRRKGSKG